MVTVDPGKIAVELDDAGLDSGVEAETVAESAGGYAESDDRIWSPFDPEKIDVDTRSPTVSLLLKRLKRGALDLEPEFQRVAGIWNETNQSRLIESLLLKIPLPTLYAAEEPDNDRWVVVDGVQRLTAIARFVDPDAVSKERLQLRGLEYLSKYNGYSFEDLPQNLRTRIEETEIVVHLIKSGTPEEVKFNIFARINTGGKPLSFQELRHALIPGRARGLLATLATSGAFTVATLQSVSPSRMADREMVLRFLAFRMTPPENYRSSDLNEFLRTAMHKLNELDEDAIHELRQDFSRSMEVASAIFGEYAFRKLYRGQRRRLPINKALFEVISVALAALDDVELGLLVRRRFRVLEAYMDLMEDSAFDAAISFGTGDVNKVLRRFTGLAGMFADVAAE